MAMSAQGHPGRPGGVAPGSIGAGASQTGPGGHGASLRDRLPVGVADASVRPSLQRGHSAPGGLGLGLGLGPGPGVFSYPPSHQPHQHHHQQQQNQNINTPCLGQGQGLPHQQFPPRGGRMHKNTPRGGTSSNAHPQSRGIPHVNSSPSLSTLVELHDLSDRGVSGGGGDWTFSGRRKAGTSLHMSSPDLFSLFQGQGMVSLTYPRAPTHSIILTYPIISPHPTILTY